MSCDDLILPARQIIRHALPPSRESCGGSEKLRPRQTRTIMRKILKHRRVVLLIGTLKFCRNLSDRKSIRGESRILYADKGDCFEKLKKNLAVYD